MGSRKVLISLVTFFSLLMAQSMALGQDAGKSAENVITGLEVQHQGQGTQVVLHGKKTPTFTVFKLKNPDRLVVDLLHTDLEGVETPRGDQGLCIGRIATTQFRQAGNIVSRFIIGLKPGVRFNAKAKGSALVISLQNHALAAGQSSPEQTKTMPASPAALAPKDHEVVESQGDRKRAGKVKIKRLVTDDQKGVTVLADGHIDAYQVIEVFKPFRIVLDVFGASMRGKKLERNLSGSKLEKLRAAQHKDKVRVVLHSQDGLRRPYQVKRLPRGIRIVMGEDAKESAQAKVKKPAPAKLAKAMPAPSAKPKVVPIAPAPVAPKPATISNLKDIEFRKDKGEVRVILDLQGEAMAKVMHADKRSTILEIPKCTMPLILERTLDTSEFDTVVRSLSAYRVRGKESVKLVAVTNSKVGSRLEKRSGKLHWVFAAPAESDNSSASASAPAAESPSAYSYQPKQVAGYSVRQPELAAGAEGGSKKRRKYKGKRISLDFVDADIHNILRLIAEVAKLNIITSDEVTGKVTIAMRNVPWDQALDIILKTKKLGKVRHGNIIRVAPLAEIVAEQEMARKMAKEKETLEPLRVRLIPVNYAVASDMTNKVKDILSERGTVNVDTRTNVIIVKDILQNLIKAEGMVRSLDTETPQVLIEARIVEANTNFVREVGIQWGGDLGFSEAYGNPTGLPFPSSVQMSGGADDTQTMSAMSGTASPGHFAINMPAAVGAGSGGALGFIFGSAGGNAHLNLRLSALENRGAVKIISAPKITTLDNEKAKISQGVSIPIAVVSAAGVNTQFVEAKLELEVSPHITQEGSILMSIKVKKNEPDFSRTGARGDPTILKKEAETQVLVRDGDTTVIGGIYTRKTSETFKGIPIVSEIPVLGWFFRGQKEQDDRTELLIFITPRVVNRLRSTVTQR